MFSTTEVRRWLPGYFVLALIAIVLLFALGAIGGCAPPQVHTEADRARFDAIAPRHFTYLTADPKLSDDARDSALDTLRFWREDLLLRGEKPRELPATAAPTAPPSK